MKKKILILFTAILITGIFFTTKAVQQTGMEDNFAGFELPQEPELNTYRVNLNQPLTSEIVKKFDKIGSYEGQTGDRQIIVRTAIDKKDELQKQPFVSKTEKYAPATDITNNYSQHGGHEKVIITLFSPADKQSVQEKVIVLGGRVLDGAGESGRSLLVEIPVSGLSELENNAKILYLEHYNEPSLLNDRARDITGAGSLAVKGFISTEGLNGKGQILALADSGLDTGDINDMHPDLKNNNADKSKIIMLKSWAGVDKPADTIGHGTHMAATMVGSGSASNGKYAGMASSARLIFQGIVNKNDQVVPPVNIEELFQPAYALGARIHVNGWGREGNKYSSTSAQIDRFVRDHPDFFAVFGAGNKGPDGGTVTAEANSKNALVVGASASPRPAFDSTNIDASLLSDFSSRGPTADGRIKPELLAPGTSIISASSRMLEGNLPGRPMYTRMQGTSMAAAVAGGSAAILREYLDENDYHTPSGALIKALLINGARVSQSGPGWDGFGVIDLSGTILSLKENKMLFDDNTTGVENRDTITYKYNVESPDDPLKVTLSWVDPPALPGAPEALVNNLDLTVITPNGKQYYGNHFLNHNRRDEKNNVEQVYIPDPAPGTYIIKVIGANIIKSAGKSDQAQDYAVVYGQPLQSQVVEEDFDKEFITFGGENMHYDLNGHLVTDTGAGIYPGTRIYKGNDDIYLTGRYWHVYGVQARKTRDGILFAEVDPEVKEGGYYSATEDFTVNGETYKGIDIELPPGAEIIASLDPFSQKLYRVNLFYKEIRGVVSYVAEDMTKLTLVDNSRQFKLSPNLSLIYEDTLRDTDPLDTAFGSHGEIQKILPGMLVTLVISPTSSEVQSVLVNRQVVLSKVVNVGDGEISLENGKTYDVLPGIPVVKNREQDMLSDINTGDYVTVLLLPDTDKIIGLTVNTDVIYGKVTYYSARDKSVYLNTLAGKLEVYKLNPDTDIYRWGNKSDAASVTTNAWVRMIIDDQSAGVLQVDMAESLPVETKVLSSYDTMSNTLITDDGSSYSLSKYTRVLKDSFPVPAYELTGGDNLQLEFLVAADSDRVVADIQAAGSSQGNKPVLKVSTVPLSGSYWVVGQTNAIRLYIRDKNGFSALDIDSNQFAFNYVPEKRGKTPSLVAIGHNGEVSGIELSFSLQDAVAFNDINAHWAKADLINMAGERLISGYTDGSFRPDNPVTRAEFTTLLARAFGMYSAAPDMPSFKDNKEIPFWAKGSITAAFERDLIFGYPDGRFRPYAFLTRQEECVILSRVLSLYNLDKEFVDAELPFEDAGNISHWALPGVRRLYGVGIVHGRTVNKFIPAAPATRAETAVTIYRLLKTIREREQEGVVM